MSLRAFARLVGVNESTVRKGIATGRLEVSVQYDTLGCPYIADVPLAEREWRTNKCQ
jgi:hypothetical protein